MIWFLGFQAFSLILAIYFWNSSEEEDEIYDYN